MELLPMNYSNNTFIKIINLVDLDNALNDTMIYERVKNAFFRLLKGEVLGGTLARLDEDKALNQAICKLLKTTYNIVLKDLEDDILKETLNKIKKDEDLYKDLYQDLDDKQLVAKLRAATHDDELSDAFDTALRNVLNAWFSRVEKHKLKLCKTLQTEALQRGNINYYLEVSKVLNWLSFEYCQSADATKEFIKKHIGTIIESNHPNKTLERLQLFHFAQLRELDSDRFKKFLDTSLEHLQAFEQLVGNSSSKDPGYPRIENIAIDTLNQKNVRAFIASPALSPLKIINKEPSEPINFFTFLSVLWWALVNRNKNSQGLIARFVTAFEEIQNKNKEFKAYQEELSELIKKYQNIYNSGLDRLALKILDENGEVKNEIDFMALANDLCALSYLYCFGITLAKKNPIMDKFFEKFNYPNTVDPIVKGKLEVLSWIYQGFYGNMDNAGKEFIQQHLDKIMGCNRPKEALNALFFIFFYKLHDKTNANDIIDAVLKNNSPESFFKEFMIRLVSLNEHPNLLKEDEVSSVLVQCSQSSTNGASEITTLKKAAKIPGPITAWCSFYGCKGHRSLEADANNNEPDTRATLDSKNYGVSN
ncbi:MAG: hypothetical protein CFE62_001640 [Candidatus Aquirickettsiella gammari]|uniref:Uncharacterized protein n=1 Tax=Candidatus Aquirickettsiella gammari TaxID=2016198 RepID=A0A370CJ22_9COXI|nr:MAG: hypothetical protein CFE62_001640 [Candidatus Aquirickettsiella gammari]